MKKIIAITTLALSVLLFASCGNSKESGGSKEDSKKMTVLLSEEPGEGDAMTTMLNKWADETGNEVETIVIPYDDQLTKFPLMVKNNDVPDLVATTRLTRLYPEEFVDLSDVMDTDIFDKDALQVVSQDYSGKQVLVAPNEYTVTTSFYNKDAFEKAGIEVPTIDKPWTLDELYKNAELLQKNGGVKYGLAMDFSRGRYDNLMYSNGGSMVEKSGDTFKTTINSKENIETLEKFIEINDSGVMPKVIWTGGSSDNPADYFKNGDIGIYMSGSWQYSTFKNDIKDFGFGILPSPKGSKQQSAIAGGGGLAIPSASNGQKLSKEFLNWFYAKENFEEYLELGEALSFVTDASYEPQDDQTKADFEIMQAEMNVVTKEFKVDESSEWRNYLDNEYRDYLKQAVSGEVSAEKALTSFAKDLSDKSGWEISK